tara:strand:- start:293 stop:619 length:327 start_codon:yes stop_codon:yes gene_type:complete
MFRVKKTPNKRMLSDWFFAARQNSRKCGRYGSMRMKFILLMIFMVPALLMADDICKDNPSVESSALNWNESDFNEKSASESMAALQEALKKLKGSVTTENHSLLMLWE